MSARPNERSQLAIYKDIFFYGWGYLAWAGRLQIVET